MFRKNGLINVLAYTDADWGGDKDGCQSTSGYFNLIGGNLATRKSKNKRLLHCPI